MIQTHNLSFSYNKEIQFSFPNIICNPQETLLITGGSGKGKTTLLHLLGGLLKPTNGSIQINGTEISGLSNANLDAFRGSTIGFVLQQNYFVSSLSVLDNVVMASWFSNQKKEIDKAKSLLSALDLTSQMHKLPSQLSVGQRQRVSIARALINEPKLLLADEPTSSLDDENAHKVADLLQSLAFNYKAALIIVTHDQRLKDQFSHQMQLS